MSDIGRAQVRNHMILPGDRVAEPGKPWYGTLGCTLVAYLLTLPLVVLGAEFGAGLLAPAAWPHCPPYRGIFEKIGGIRRAGYLPSRAGLA